MNISQNGIDLIKKFEGCRLKAYLCPAGVWTIGVGHTGNVKAGQIITQVEADNLLKQDLQKFVTGVNGMLQTTVNQNQFDALVSFAYNCGLGALKKSTLLEYVNKRNFAVAAKEFDKWVKAGGETLQGLVNRRNAEQELFLKPAPKATPCYLKTGTFPNREMAEKMAKELKDKYGWITHVMEVE